MRSLYGSGSMENRPKKVQLSIILHCSENSCLCVCLLHCPVSTSSLGPMLFYCYSGLNTGDPPYLVFEYTDWLIVVLIASSTFCLKMTFSEPTVCASALQQAHAVLWQSSSRGESKWKVFHSATQILQILYVLAGKSLSLRSLAWT